ncbi:uncharacterized protein LOC142663437 [Rhinoderma darwinii]|uniref:uncharacterized protein LOC142663437 n=1 Tax=Rhinoderma darwinii TaxID=43563 RepID=UPI003F66B0F9
MDEDRNHMTERIVKLTLEIIYLLTGEGHVVVKKEPNERIEVSSLLKYKRCNEQRILELTNKIIELLTREVPIRCQDVAVYFSIEEWEYLEEHKDLYKDVMMEDHRDRTPRERCPSPGCSPNNSKESKEPSEDGNLNIVVVDIDPKIEQTHVQIKEEEIPTDINMGFHQNLNLSTQDTVCQDEQGSLLNTQSAAMVNELETFYSDMSIDQSKYIKQTVISPADKQKGKFPCPVCGKRFNSNSYLIIHQMIHTGEKPFTCPDCQKCFRQKSELTVHKRIHTGEKPFSCPSCGKCFRQKSYLIVHQRIHTGEKPYTCKDCGKRFISSTYLASHQRNHQGEKSFVCPECGKSFRHRAGLVSHQITHTGEKSFECPKCDKTFRQRSGLVAHQKTHTGEKTFICTECEKSFYSHAKMREHYKIHTGNKPYKCTDCGKCFSQRSQLVSHQKIHSVEKPYSCSECEKCFKRSTHLVKHQRIHRKYLLQ